LARLNECNEAVSISQILLQVVKDDEIAVYNANEMINICQTNLKGTATPTLNPESGEGNSTVTPTSESTP
jgi:hypothetical protein